MGAGRFDAKVGIVMGAAGGIGSATVRGFAREGAYVIVVDIDDDAGRALVDGLTADGLSAEYHHCNVLDGDEVEALYTRLADVHPRLDFAANIVGGSGPLDVRGMELHEQTEVMWESSLSFSLMSALLCMKHEITAMLAGGGGAIVNVASMAGVRVTFNATPAYAAAKAGLIHVSRYAAVQYAARGIRVNVVAPGMTATPKAVAVLGEETINEIAVHHCIPRAATAEDQANAMIWLCSDEAAMITGHVVPVDGGWNAR